MRQEVSLAGGLVHTASSALSVVHPLPRILGVSAVLARLPKEHLRPLQRVLLVLHLLFACRLLHPRLHHCRWWEADTQIS